VYGRPFILKRHSTQSVERFAAEARAHSPEVLVFVNADTHQI
jgi:hypothetical protein